MLRLLVRVWWRGGGGGVGGDICVQNFFVWVIHTFTFLLHCSHSRSDSKLPAECFRHIFGQNNN